MFGPNSEPRRWSRRDSGADGRLSSWIPWSLGEAIGCPLSENLRKDIPCSLGSFAVFFQPGMDQSSHSYQWINSSNGTSRISRWYPLIFPSKNQIFPLWTPIQNSQPGSPVLLRWLLGGCSGSLCAAEPFRGLRAFHSTGLRPHQEGLQPKGSCCKWVHPDRRWFYQVFHLWHITNDISKYIKCDFFPRFPPGNPKNFGPPQPGRAVSAAGEIPRQQPFGAEPLRPQQAVAWFRVLDRVESVCGNSKNTEIFFWRLKDGLFIESCWYHLRFSC